MNEKEKEEKIINTNENEFKEENIDNSDSEELDEEDSQSKVEENNEKEETFESVKEELETFKEKLLRSLAENENIRKQMDKSRLESVKYGVQPLARELLSVAIKDNNPVVFLEHELLYNEKFILEDDKKSFKIGEAKIMTEGNDLTIVTYSRSVKLALEAEKILKEKNISCEIINLRSIKPLDKKKIIKSVKKTNRLLVIEEGWSVCGIASEVISIVTDEAFDFLDAPPSRICGADVPLPYAENLEKSSLPSLNSVLVKCEELCNL